MREIYEFRGKDDISAQRDTTLTKLRKLWQLRARNNVTSWRKHARGLMRLLEQINAVYVERGAAAMAVMARVQTEADVPECTRRDRTRFAIAYKGKKEKETGKLHDQDANSGKDLQGDTPLCRNVQAGKCKLPAERCRFRHST